MLREVSFPNRNSSSFSKKDLRPESFMDLEKV